MSREPARGSVSGSMETIIICHDLGCRAQSTVTFSREQLVDITHLFEPTAKTPRNERGQIREAVALFERIAGQQTSVYRDKGKNPNSITPPSRSRNLVRTASLSLVPSLHYDSIEGQMDCVDESRNTTLFLELLEQQGLLAWHRVLGAAFRTPYLFDQHWSAQIEEAASGQRFAVDSWVLDNGEPPYIQRLGAWKRGRPLPEEGFE